MSALSKLSGRGRPSMSETNLLKYRPQRDYVNYSRPESALGLLQGKLHKYLDIYL